MFARFCWKNYTVRFSWFLEVGLPLISCDRDFFLSFCFVLFLVVFGFLFVLCFDPFCLAGMLSCFKIKMQNFHTRLRLSFMMTLQLLILWRENESFYWISDEPFISKQKHWVFFLSCNHHHQKRFCSFQEIINFLQHDGVPNIVRLSPFLDSWYGLAFFCAGYYILWRHSDFNSFGFFVYFPPNLPDSLSLFTRFSSLS